MSASPADASAHHREGVPHREVGLHRGFGPHREVAPHREFARAVRAVLAEHADPARAAAQRAYMKSELPYYGLAAPLLRTALAPLLRDSRLAMSSPGEWAATIEDLWRTATHREEWYAAIALARHRAYATWVAPEAMDLWERLIRGGAWWDVVDDIATHLVRDTVRGWPETEMARMRAWATTDNLWVRRSAILCQVGVRDGRRPELLAAVIEPNVTDTEFFIRKAIGWALRDYAYRDPAWVRDFVGAHPELSGLSRREALKHIGAG